MIEPVGTPEDAFHRVHRDLAATLQLIKTEAVDQIPEEITWDHACRLDELLDRLTRTLVNMRLANGIRDLDAIRREVDREIATINNSQPT